MTTRIEKILEDRASERKRIALSRAKSALLALERLGVRAGLVGSLARGQDFRLHSDADFYIEDCGGVSEFKIAALIEDHMKDISFDVVFKGDIEDA